MKAHVLVFAALLLMEGETRAQTIEATATFHNIGIRVDLTSDSPPDAQVSVSVKEASDPGAHLPAHPLSRIGPRAFAGSVMFLRSGIDYSILLQSSVFTSDQVITATTRTDAFADATDRELHVDPDSGSDDNDGTGPLDALATLGRALELAGAGDKILLHDGRYLEGDHTITTGGNQSAPLVIRAAPGASPVLDGTDPDFSPAWEVFDAAAGVYRTATDREPMNAYLDGGQLFHYLDLDDLCDNRWTQPGGFYVDGSHMYVRFPGGGAPGGHTVTIPRHTNALTLDGAQHVHVIGIEFCYYGYGTYHQAVYIDGGDYNLVDGCGFHHNGKGVSFKRAADYNTIQNCTFTESPITTWSWDAVKSGGVGYEAGGVALYSSDEPNTGNVIRNNVFEDMFDASGLYSSDAAGATRNMDYHDNRIVGCGDDALETDGAGTNVRIYRNTMLGFLTGISVAPASGGPTYIVRNVLADWHSVQDYEGYPFKFNVDSPLSTDWVFLYHNTCTTTVPGQPGFLFKQYSDWHNVISRNNIFAGTDYALESRSSQNPVDFDYDALHTGRGPPLVRWESTDYDTVGAFAAATGQEAHGVSAVPGFVDAAAGDYQLAPGSELIDKGIPIPGVNDGFSGTAPDPGAFEHGIDDDVPPKPPTNFQVQ
jgi:parallel beta-helix repeat protein